MDPFFKKYMQALADQQGSCRKSPAISVLRYNEIVRHLMNPAEKVDSHFKAWVKGRQFQLVDLPSLGLRQVLVIPNTKANKASVCQLSVLITFYSHVRL